MEFRIAEISNEKLKLVSLVTFMLRAGNITFCEQL